MADAPKPNAGQWKKGQSGNKLGRPAVFQGVRAIANERTPEAMEQLWKMVLEGKGMVKLEAIRLWLAYGPGKPVDKVEHTGVDGGPIQLQRLSDADLEQMDAILARATAALEE